MVSVRLQCDTCQLGEVFHCLRCAHWITRSRSAIEDVCARATLICRLEVELVNAVGQALVCAFELHAGWSAARRGARGWVDV